jgi:hypothetical protein
MAALAAVREMAKQWIKSKVQEVPKHAQSAVYYIPAALAEYCYGTRITRLSTSDVIDQLNWLCQQPEDPVPEEIKNRVQVVLKKLG